MTQKRKPWFGLVFSLLVAAGAGYAAWDFTQGLASPAPFGAPLPEIAPIYEVLPDDRIAQASLVKRQLPEVMLELLCLQPDGAPPLRYTISCEIGDFQIRHPYGAQTISYPIEEVQEDRTMIEAILKFDQPLQMLKYTAENRRQGETVAEYAKRLHAELEESGVAFYPDTTPFEVDDYRFEHFEYRRTSPEGEELAHSIYIGSLGRRNALVMNFVTAPELHEQARPTIIKILNSFIPGWKMLNYNREEMAELDGGPSVAADSA